MIRVWLLYGMLRDARRFCTSAVQAPGDRFGLSPAIISMDRSLTPESCRLRYDGKLVAVSRQHSAFSPDETVKLTADSSRLKAHGSSLFLQGVSRVHSSY
ncbi:MAG: hypothetical protein WD768_21490, partial [Phycisphaeraceae bacterium]